MIKTFSEMIEVEWKRLLFSGVVSVSLYLLSGPTPQNKATETKRTKTESLTRHLGRGYPEYIKDRLIHQ